MGPFDRHPADDYDPDALGTFWQDRARMEDTLPRGGADEVPVRLLRCPLCHKPLAAMADCASCGDETDVERTGGGARETSGTPDSRQDGVAIPARPLSAREEAA